MSKRVLVAAALAAALIVAWYFASPLFAVRNLKAAAIAGDAERLEQLVDFPAVREGLKGQLNAMLLKSMQTDPEMADNPFSGLAILLLPAMVERGVDAFVTPEAISTMLVKGEAKPNASSAGGAASQSGTSATVAPNAPTTAAETHSKAKVRYSFRDLNTFKVASAAADAPATKVEFVFRRQGLFGWRMARINLPSDMMSR